MAHKTKLEHRVKHISMDGETWPDEFGKIEKLCDDMWQGGWSLHTMSWPDQQNAVLVFTRTRPGRGEG